jgi:hypothetical protein
MNNKLSIKLALLTTAATFFMPAYGASVPIDKTKPQVESFAWSTKDKSLEENNINAEQRRDGAVIKRDDFDVHGKAPARPAKTQALPNTITEPLTELIPLDKLPKSVVKRLVTHDNHIRLDNENTVGYLDFSNHVLTVQVTTKSGIYMYNFKQETRGDKTTYKFLGVEKTASTDSKEEPK